MTKEEFDLKSTEAQEELGKKSYKEIQIETAYKWAARAAASYRNVLIVDRNQKFGIYLLAQEYEHEAVEHASLVNDHSENVLQNIQELLESYRGVAWIELEIGFDL